MTKIEHSYQYLAEESKVKFQYNVNEMFEIRQFLRDKLTNASNPSSVFFDAHELNVLDEWLTTAATNLLTDYEILHRAGKLQQLNYDVATGLLRRTPNIKDLLKA